MAVVTAEIWRDIKWKERQRGETPKLITFGGGVEFFLDLDALSPPPLFFWWGGQSSVGSAASPAPPCLH